MVNNFWSMNIDRLQVNLWVMVVVCMVTLFFVNAAQAAEISVTADREPVRLDESFKLVFQTSESPDGDPDFSPLQKDFEILNQGQTSNISIVNGSYSKNSQWHLTVMAKRIGKLTVPPIRFGNDESRSIIITVNSQELSQVDPARGSSGAAVLLEIDVEPENPYVQSQVIYTVRLLHRVTIAQAQLTEPEAENAIIERLGENVSYSTLRQGTQYRVVERKYAIFPQQSGFLMIEPLELTAQIASTRRRGSTFDNFFNPRGGTQTKRLYSKLTALKVKPIPAEFNGRYWLPAESLSLQEYWTEGLPRLIAGEPTTRTLKIESKGLSAGQLPELNSSDSAITATNGGEVKQYPDQPALQESKTATGLTSSRVENTALIPSKAGYYTLPAIEIPWWNTQTDQMEIAKIPAQLLKATGTATAIEPAIITSPQTVVNEITSQVDTATISNVPEDRWLWKGVSLVLALGWASTLVFWWIRKPRQSDLEQAESEPEVPIKKVVIKSLKRACSENDPQKVKNALVGWAQAIWPDSQPNGLGEVGRRCGSNLKNEIDILNQHLYSNTKSAWRGQALWSAFTEYKSNKSTIKNKDVVGLQPLYKL